MPLLLVVANGFVGSVFGRLDVSPSSQPFGAAPLNPNDRWSFYSNVNYSDGGVNRQFYASNYDYITPPPVFGSSCSDHRPLEIRQIKPRQPCNKEG